MNALNSPSMLTLPPATRAAEAHGGELKLFTLWREGELDTEDVAMGTRNLAKAPPCGPGAWWVVTLSAKEVVRDESGALVPLSRQQLVASALDTSRLRARLSWGLIGQGHCVDVDIGAGVRLSVAAGFVDVKVLGPAGRVRETQANDARPLGPLGGGTYLDTLVGAEIVPSAAPTVDAPLTLTQLVTVPRGMADRAIAIPPFARCLRVFQPAPSRMQPMAFRIGTAGPVVADVFLSQNLRSAEATVPQVASHLTTGPADTASARLFTLVWTLGF